MGSLQLALDLRELSAPPVQVWDGVPEEHQVAVVAALARLIAKAAVPPSDVPPSEDGEDGAQGEEVGDDE
jgi:hypothetical protein